MPGPSGRQAQAPRPGGRSARPDRSQDLPEFDPLQSWRLLFTENAANSSLQADPSRSSHGFGQRGSHINHARSAFWQEYAAVASLMDHSWRHPVLENLIGRGQNAPNGRDKVGLGSTRRPVIGLVLGGGAARGFAHIGIVRTLVAHGL